MESNVFKYLKFRGFVVNGLFREIEFYIFNGSFRYRVDNGSGPYIGLIDTGLFKEGIVEDELAETFVKRLIHSPYALTDAKSFTPIHSALWSYEIGLRNKVFRNRGRVYDEPVFNLLELIDEVLGPGAGLFNNVIKSACITYSNNEYSDKEVCKLNFKERCLEYTSTTIYGKSKLESELHDPLVFNLFTALSVGGEFERNVVNDNILKDRVPTFKFELSFYKGKKKTYYVFDENLSFGLTHLLKSCSELLNIKSNLNRLYGFYTSCANKERICLFCEVSLKYRGETVTEWYKDSVTSNVKKGDLVLVSYGNRRGLFKGIVKDVYSSEFMNKPPVAISDNIKNSSRPLRNILSVVKNIKY